MNGFKTKTMRKHHKANRTLRIRVILKSQENHFYGISWLFLCFIISYLYKVLFHKYLINGLSSPYLLFLPQDEGRIYEELSFHEEP